MKTTTALYVREDGKILIGEFPVEPEKPEDFQTKGGLMVHVGGDFGYDKAWMNYQLALKEAIDKAVEVADQEQAKDMIHALFSEPRGSTADHKPEFTIKPGVYPIPGVRYEVREEPIERDESTYSHYEREAGKQLVTHFKKVAFIL